MKIKRAGKVPITSPPPPATTVFYAPCKCFLYPLCSTSISLSKPDAVLSLLGESSCSFAAVSSCSFAITAILVVLISLHGWFCFVNIRKYAYVYCFKRLGSVPSFILWGFCNCNVLGGRWLVGWLVWIIWMFWMEDSRWYQHLQHACKFKSFFFNFFPG